MKSDWHKYDNDADEIVKMFNDDWEPLSLEDFIEDEVNNPRHYTQGEIECIDAMRSALTEEEFRGYCKGAAFKYIWRERHKGGNQSLQKAVWYLEKINE